MGSSVRSLRARIFGVSGSILPVLLVALASRDPWCRYRVVGSIRIAVARGYRAGFREGADMVPWARLVGCPCLGENLD